MIRISLAIGLFNAIMNYFPFTNNRFGELYGFGNLDTLFYFLIPYSILFKLSSKKGINLITKLLLVSSSFGIYYAFKFVYIKEYRSYAIKRLNMNFERKLI